MTTKVLKTLIPVLLALLMLPLSGLVSPTEFNNDNKGISYSEPLIVDSAPPLICGDNLCPVPDRMYQRDGRAASEQWGWWFSYGPDEDANGMDDRLQRILDGRFESQSPTAIIGPDGQKTVAIIVDWAWHPSEVEQSQLKETLFSHGWIGQENGAWWQVLHSIDSITVDKVPLSALVDIWSLEGVVVIEQQSVMVPFLDTATPAVLARPSDIYSNTAFEQGYTGSGVVIAILDTGVDNEHRSLNDFDDQNDEPDLSPTSYDDPKWVAGYDATSSTSQRDGTADPDDGAGHGSHCAGIALGTGDARGVNMGAAPGAYLVDVKVLTDFGGTNSQSSVNGIQWVIDNKDTNWGNNGSSIGIQIASMSFGSVSNPADQDDTGNNGSDSSAENRLVNNASANGVIMVAAMGNDGARRVPSPAAADSAITVAAINNRGSVNRSDDTIASYSNYGPRDSDDDNDDWDELKPDVSAPGSDIMSVSAATGSSIPGQPRPEADNEYETQSGTSMSTPLVSGVIALALEANPGLDPYEMKDLIRNYSQVKGSADLPSISDKWDDHWGFGMIDASCLVNAARGLECDGISGGGDEPPSPPGENGTGQVVNITIPTNDSWMITEKMTRIKGAFDESLNGRDFIEVHVRITRDGEELMPWTKAGGSTGNWLIDFKPESNWGDGEIAWIEAKAMDSLGDWSESVYAKVKIGEHKVSFTSPSGHDSLVGDITFGGSWEGIEPSMIQYRVDAGDWSNGDSLTTVDYGDGTWNINWDSETVDDGTHRFTVRLENQSGYFSDELRRSFTVDNEPPSPELSILGGVKVLQHGVDVSQALTLTHLIVEADIINNGDSAARDLEIRLHTGSGSQSIDQTISHLGPGQVKTVQFIWKPLLAGQRILSLEIDPGQKQGEENISNNEFDFTFTVLERPDAVDLTMFEGACVAVPR
ncbi:MAG: S8 family serine peptidase, partial [Euryarchaeota archaeon]|nr:S8 family serine peptidase [Euryarchaeota archaeon]